MGGKGTLKLLHLISEKPPVKSGFSRVISRLAEELTKMGHEVDVMSAQDCNFKAVGDIKLVIDAAGISEHIKDGDYDGINIHGHTPTFSDRLLLKSKLAGKRVVYTLHCLADYCYFKPVTMLYNSVFNNVALKLVDAVVVTSKSYYNMLHACSRKYIVPWGVDYDEFSGKRIPHDGYQLLFVGQMRPYKGMKVLFQAVKGIDAELSMVGDGYYRAEYEAYAHKLGLGNVHFHGIVSNDVLRRLYLSSDVLVLPSVGVNEAFGLVTLEAAAAGCAVVASDLPGVRDVVKEFGMLVKPNNSDSLKDALVTLSDEAVRKKYVGEGLDAATKYSWHKVAEEYAKIYEGTFSRA
jgi:glycosyltransferase involved in cell wall biosynthesis